MFRAGFSAVRTLRQVNYTRVKQGEGRGRDPRYHPDAGDADVQQLGQHCPRLTSLDTGIIRLRLRPRNSLQ